MHRRTLLKSGGALAAASLARPALAAAQKPLRFVPQANLSVLDPIWTTSLVTGEFGYYVYDTLYSADPQLQPKPQMAAGHTVSDDKRTYRITLRDGLKFHDNTPVRAQDCVASIARWSQRDTFGIALAAATSHMSAADDKTILIVLKQPFPVLDALAKPDASTCFVMPERLASQPGTTQLTEVMGSGPYRWIAGDYVTNSRAAFEKFDGYVPRSEPPVWGTGGKAAHYQRIEWHMIADAATASAALQSGEVDWVEQPLADLIPQLAADKRIGIAVINPLGDMALMRLNCLQPPFDNVKVRQAVRLAVNQTDYMSAAVGDNHSLWEVCPSLFPCGTPNAAPSKTLMPASLDQARAALKASGYNNEPVVIINPSNFALINPLGQVTYALLKQLGMNVTLAESDWGSVVQRRASMKPVAEGGWSIFHTFGSSENYANPATSSLVRGLGKQGWFGWWSSQPAEALVGQWFAASDAATRDKIAQQLATLALTDVATIPLGQFRIPTAYRKTITGLPQGVAAFPWTVRPA